MTEHHYDPEADIFWLVLGEGPEERVEEVFPGVNLEFGPDGRLLGIEILQASRFSENLQNTAKDA